MQDIYAKIQNGIFEKYIHEIAVLKFFSFFGVWKQKKINLIF